MFHHVAVAVKDVKKAHKFYTEAMGFKLVKAVKRQSPEGGWTKHIFYDTGKGELFAIWDLKGLDGVALNNADWKGGISTGANLPYWVNHIAFDCQDIGGLEEHKQRWLDHGYHVVEVKHEFIHSIYTRDPDGTLVEWTFDTVPLNEDDVREAEEILADDTPAEVPEYEGIVHKTQNKEKRKREEQELENSGAAI